MIPYKDIKVIQLLEENHPGFHSTSLQALLHGAAFTDGYDVEAAMNHEWCSCEIQQQCEVN